ncbi:dihydroorotase [Geminicoccus flavidas]|uniref:dihydroorotase n=1 Tax=Geminicoccus flavidas TaxID=2506407 RepID=UPI0013569D23|nr:dihydroorotase [Geminicoccus flavidas]
MQPLDLLIAGGRLVTPGGLVAADLGIRDGRIAAIGALDGQAAAERLDARGLHVLPGVIDSQVHFREPGLEHKEDLASGSDAAVLGGVTTVFEMPNTSPATIDAQALDDKLKRASGRMRCDHAFYVGATAENVGQLAELERRPGSAGIKIFMGSSTGSLLVEDDASLERVLRAGSRRVAVHAEDEPRLRARKALAEAAGDPVAHPEWRDVEAATLAVTRLLRAARAAGRRVHVLHVTSAEEIELLAQARDVASVEVTPHHLTMQAPDCYQRLGTRAQMNPPVRDARHREALWQAVTEGVVDVLGSDHAPHTLDEKAKPYPASPSGMTGVQTLLPVMLDHVAQGRLSLERLVDLTGHGPQRIFQLAGKGRIMRGYDADLVLVDLEARWRIEAGWLASRAGWSPYEGMTITGRPVATLVRGRIVARDGALVGDPMGRPVRFLETLGG